MSEGATTAESPGRGFSFGEFTLDLDRAELRKGATDLRLRPKSFDVLRYLAENHGRVVSKDELLNAVWGRAVVSEGSIAQCVIDIRRALGDREQSLIRTVSRRGYVFDAPVSALANDRRRDQSRYQPPYPLEQGAAADDRHASPVVADLRRPGVRRADGFRRLVAGDERARSQRGCDRSKFRRTRRVPAGPLFLQSASER